MSSLFARVSRWGGRSVLTLLLFFAYTNAWRPARVLLTENVTHPVLSSIDTQRARTTSLTLAAGGLTIRLNAHSPERSPPGYRAPVGILFLLPVLILAFFFPFKPYWFYFWLFHLGLGTFELGMMALGIGWADWGFVVYRFSRRYLSQGLSLAIPVLALYAEKIGPEDINF